MLFAFRRLENGFALRSRSLLAYVYISLSVRLREVALIPVLRSQCDRGTISKWRTLRSAGLMGSTIVLNAGAPVSPALISPPSPLDFLLLCALCSPWLKLCPRDAPDDVPSSCGKGSIFSVLIPYSISVSIQQIVYRFVVVSV